MFVLTRMINQWGPQSSHRQYPSGIESLFNHHLSQIREHTVAFSVQKSFEQMEDSLFYEVKVQALPIATAELVSYPVIHHVDLLTDLHLEGINGRVLNFAPGCGSS
jgi:hypothetical protein